MTQRKNSKSNDGHWHSAASEGERNYKRLLAVAVLSVGLVAVIPLVVMTVANYVQYQQAFSNELTGPMARMTRTARHSVQFFLTERRAALQFVVLEEPLERLKDSEYLDQLLTNLTSAFGGFIDLGLIAQDGQHTSYAGPYPLAGDNYAEDDWFHQVWEQGTYTSEVFLGHRDVPHFVIAVRFHNPLEGSFVLRATIDTEAINKEILNRDDAPFVDAFLVNREGVLQTSSRSYGDVLQACSLQISADSEHVEVVETDGDNGEPLLVGMARIQQTPFTVMLVSRQAELGESWLSLKRNLLFFLLASVVAILGVVLWGSRSMIHRIRESDLKRASLLHQMEYTNKMAAMGRLAAGVAHEINNPLAIINEKTGLAKDLLTLADEIPPKGRFVELLDSILRSVKRCSRITHRLLGFAKHVRAENEWINLANLLQEVFSFLEREASYRNLRVTFDLPEQLATIWSDRGQLQQVFLNILNNAFAAVDDEGAIRISAQQPSSDTVSVAIEDDGEGIKEDDLKYIFEPFFSTKGAHGTGLGLSVTYGMVQKLGGQIEVESTVREGTTFTVTLPVGTNGEEE